MANFVLLYTGGRMLETDAERARVMEAWNACSAALATRLPTAATHSRPRRGGSGQTEA